jgi:sugar phosphate isomerase/epimerase
VPPEIVFGVELDDGLAEVVGTDLEDTLDNRLPGGEGVFDVPVFINAVLAIGWDGPWGIEHMSGDFRRLPVRDALTRARDAALHCFDLAAQRRDADTTRG